MDSISGRSGSSLPLEQVIALAMGELRRLRYSRRTLRRYRIVWRHLLEFSKRTSSDARYSDEIAARFLETYGRVQGECDDPGEEWQRRAAFAVKILVDFVRDGGVERGRVETCLLRVPEGMTTSLKDYAQFCRDRRHLRPSSLQARMRTISLFTEFLGSRGATSLAQVQAEDVAAFIASRGRLGPRAASTSVSDVRCFLRFLLQRGTLSRDLTPVLPKVRVPRDASVPSVWDEELVGKLLQAVDRASPTGKRDYAILLLASRLGLRLGDIRTLRLDDLKWSRAAIEIVQSKTGSPLCLPMTEEVGVALIDYLKNARPHTGHREVFIRARPPFSPFAESSHLYHVVLRWRQMAGIRFRSPQRKGLHSLRHTLATRLLHEETPIHLIGQILGHANVNSTTIYAKADVESLRAAALDTEGGHHGD